MKPRLPIRRFDVFAEFNRLEALKKGADEAHAKGYGLWVAKVVASGGGRRGTASDSRASQATDEKKADKPSQKQAEQGWHLLSDEPQTDELFDKEIVHRMGDDFYAEVFAPAIAEAFKEGKSYTSIRDTIRKEWKP